ncbi:MULTISPECIES: oxidoreductase-like domain-containing protein [unclassified Colwellia]|jgi:hypothetical protein|uniref:oxidoreductase-like domain-containing protein n=2 Tax=unclassified Colwellia TaxID=196834 RepID=UPI0015F44E2F|nr:MULTISPECIES: oxidoreductase-like domain-containing protein [unclassified Colwellia]MBA6373761.1 hypothetical protein [Colwellia sp. BRX8-2]MBA6338011.1 hypothetical protein [Colwellia sp. BRX8-7]MBA6346924.1 hypothetical protein [Colwellia sp. BRX8-9]MBA6350573.1 hypothetical protein [Colwellia sp. BRX9-1]MBA6355339.1 hypothetical protein [Colwellia sp. BRX8-3]|tara:strand:- start:1600 stop:1797 length:198 start_codon:yes stop_codon:yes gene_type:complete
MAYTLLIEFKNMTELLEKPLPPADGECCDSACTPCVWDNFYAKRKEWRLQQVALKEKQAQDNESN